MEDNHLNRVKTLALDRPRPSNTNFGESLHVDRLAALSLVKLAILALCDFEFVFFVRIFIQDIFLIK